MSNSRPSGEDGLSNPHPLLALPPWGLTLTGALHGLCWLISPIELYRRDYFSCRLHDTYVIKISYHSHLFCNMKTYPKRCILTLFHIFFSEKMFNFLKDHHKSFSDRIKVARGVWNDAAVILPNKEQTLLDWSSGLLTGKHRYTKSSWLEESKKLYRENR